MRRREDLTATRVREVLNYDPDTGAVIRIARTAQRVRIGDVAGWIDKQGYRIIKVDGGTYKAHCLAWLWMIGAWPIKDIDHINLDKSDNRWCNLREATRSQNCAHKPRNRNNTSGFKGVSWYRKYSKWVARIGVNGKGFTLGYRDTREEAAALYDDAAKKHFGMFANS
jgi:hypothetical protein